jgi:hypothetical protein
VESLPSKKKGPQIEKKREQGLISKNSDTSWRSSMFQKKDDEIYKLLGEILLKERKKGDHIFL